MLRTKGALTAAAATALVLSSAAVASAETITVHCAGPPPFSGPAGLINAINVANSNPDKTTIKLDSGCAYVYRQSNNTDGADGPNALPVITSPIEIVGDSGGRENALIERSAADGTPAFRLFDIASNGDLTLKVITVSGGRTPDGNDGSDDMSGGNGGNAPDGGGILNKGSLTLQHSTVTRNVTGNGGNGGNGSVMGGGNGGNGGNGGGIANRGTTTTKDGSTVSGNVTGDGGNGGSGNTNGGNGGNGGDGAGLDRSAGTTAVRDSSTVSGNETGDGGNGGSGNLGNGGNGGKGGNGGGDATDGPAGTGSGFVFTLDGGSVLVAQNLTGNGGNGGDSNAGNGGNGGNGGDGGGNYTNNSRFLSNGATTSNNSTGDGGSGGSPSGTAGQRGVGGGFASFGSTLTINQGAITFNSARSGGAVYHRTTILSVNGTRFAGNTPNNCDTPAPGCPA